MLRYSLGSILAALFLSTPAYCGQDLIVGPRSIVGNRTELVPNATQEQTTAIALIQTLLRPFSEDLDAARDELALASYVLNASGSTLRSAVEKVAKADLALATARGDALTGLQSSQNKLDPAQVKAFIALITRAPTSVVLLNDQWGSRTPAPLLPRSFPIGK